MTQDLWRHEFSSPSSPIAVVQDGEVVALHTAAQVEAFDADSAIALGELLVEAGRRAAHADKDPGNYKQFDPDRRVITVELINPVESFYRYFTLAGLADWAAHIGTGRHEGLNLAALALADPDGCPLPGAPFPPGHLRCSDRTELARQFQELVQPAGQ